MNIELLNLLTIDDLKGEVRDLAEVVGMESFINLLKYYGGTSKMYIPQPDKLLIPMRDELIRREYNGNNIFELARKWELTDAYIRRIVRSKARELHSKPPDGQLSLFFSGEEV